ncbi:hypothetical protein GNT65_14965 [Shewanella sp. JBTF-M18]|uniref:Uncharacterized protein n=1 Tax=Shewanella insulae TaxID=2681496 RepID=A0A6L7I077_9GAMM|nr:hypothetical protein [Shewanella insulae]MXR69962.1 hypothetical protein [Shewanella insulae]
MNLDCIPTIESLLEQNAICFTGRPDLIDRYLDLATPHDGIALLDDKGRPSYETGNAKSFRLQSYPIYDSETKERRILEFSTLFCAGFLFKKSIAPLYTVHLDKDFTVTAHVRSNNGYFDKVIHKKTDVNPKRLTHSLKAITRAIDQSQVFFICTKCNKLIDANFRASSQATCAFNACGKLVAQHFDVSSAQVSGYIYSRYVRVDRFEDDIAISIGVVQWPHPHEPCFEWVIKKRMDLSSTPRQVKLAAKAIHDSKIAIGKCKHCRESMTAGYMFDDETCYTCAMSVYGVVY